MKTPWFLIGGICLLWLILSVIGGSASKVSARIGENQAKQNQFLESAVKSDSKK